MNVGEINITIKDVSIFPKDIEELKLGKSETVSRTSGDVTFTKYDEKTAMIEIEHEDYDVELGLDLTDDDTKEYLDLLCQVSNYQSTQKYPSFYSHKLQFGIHMF